MAEMSRRKPLLKNRAPPEIEVQIVALSLEQPAFGQIRISNEVRKRGLSISPPEPVEGWDTRGLAAPRSRDDPDLETMKKRLKALDAKVAEARPDPD